MRYYIKTSPYCNLTDKGRIFKISRNLSAEDLDVSFDRAIIKKCLLYIILQ
jgi:hypothetical protein